MGKQIVITTVFWTWFGSVLSVHCACAATQCKILNKYQAGTASSATSKHSVSSIADIKNSGSPRQRSCYKLTPASDRSKSTFKSKGSKSTSKSRAATPSVDDSKYSIGSRNKPSNIIDTSENDRAKTPTKPNIVTNDIITKESLGSIDDITVTNRLKTGYVITAANCNADIGYGKPLVTPNKRPTIRRDITHLSQTNISTSEKSDKFVRKKSPIRPWRTANSMEPVSKPAGIYNKSDAGGTRPSSKCAGKKLRASLTNTNVKAERSAVKNPVVASVLRPMSSSTRKEVISPYNASDVSDVVGSSKCFLPFRSKQKLPSNTIISARDPTRRLQRDDNGSKPYMKDIKQMSVRPSAVSQGKSYKPQLEDIKSSFLLLNKITKARIDGRKSSVIPKPQPYSESERKAILMESKTKFKTKNFWNDAKYDKIEGLNWITWK